MIKQIFKFKLNGTPISCEPYGTGHINHTYLIKTDKGCKYILQWINQNVFKNPEAVMQNITAITNYLGEKSNDPRTVLHLVPTLENKLFYIDDENETWRVYDFIDSLTIELPENPDDFYEAGVAFGRFQRSLADFNAELLSETIPRFHDTPNRFSQLKEAIKNNAKGRLKDIKKEIDLAMSFEEYGSKLVGLLTEGVLPLRVTHNDTKLNNVLFDKETRKPICIVDLDTVMPGLIAYDFGDAIRTGASTAAEDETNLSKIGVSLEMFEAFTRGFVESSELTGAELEYLCDGAKMMTIENAIRFLADHLNGDLYFKIDRPGHNLDRARAQFKLIEEMDKKWNEMQRIVRKYG
jgi:Ser/Thr protein kinase RdoA (MazF antagonist)